MQSIQGCQNLGLGSTFVKLLYCYGHGTVALGLHVKA
jgi:hypothetical protein